ncbi:MAG: hypothetical protein AAGM22_32140 [Acidobacteriota bacterium]
MIRRSQILIIACAAVALVGVPAFAQQTLFSQADPVGQGPMGGPYVPPGELFDNEQNNFTTSVASQDAPDGGPIARIADDFSIDGTGCDSGVFDISGIRIQMTQAIAVPQAFAVEVFDDNGSGTAPASGINPIGAGAEASQVNLGSFNMTLDLFEAATSTPGLQLNADTTYWVSGYGSDAAANGGGFNNFSAASNGAAGTTPNGQIIAPNSGVADWAPVESVIGGPPLAFSFAIDGECAVLSTPFDPNIPTLSPVGIGLMAGVLAILAVFVIARRRA